jgi:mannose-6-phosphate isomerase-like protein (cupin superfamily)
VAIERDDRPWGYYEVVDEGPGFKVKRICVRPGCRLSYQRHQYRAEHWYVVSGNGVATVDDQQLRVTAGSTVQVDAGARHRVANDGDVELTFIEVQTGSYFGEDDIERFDDDYGRSAAAPQLEQAAD